MPDGLSPSRKHWRVLDALMKLSGGQPDVFHDFGRVVAAMGVEAFELGRMLQELRDAGDVKLTEDAVALTDAGVTHALIGR